jgi:hypothetical protein
MTAQRCYTGHKDEYQAHHARGTERMTSSVRLIAVTGGSYFGPTETMILMSELPRIPFNMPDTWIVKESCP